MNINENNYVDKAESVIKKLSGKNDPGEKTFNKVITTSKIRNLLSMTNDIYNQVIISQEKLLKPSIHERIEYLRIRFVYEAGRDQQVKSLLDAGDILDNLKTINKDRDNYILFCRYMEALVAFHKYYINN